MRIRTRKGISMIALMISILVTVILLSVIIPEGIDKINSSRVAVFNSNIVAIGSEVNAYALMYKSELPVKKDSYNNNITYSIESKSTLLEQATKKNDHYDTFYILDIDKIKLDNKDLGVGETVDDYFLIASTSKNIYYAKGLDIDGTLYHTKLDAGDGITGVIPTSYLNPANSKIWDGMVNRPKLSDGMTAVKFVGASYIDLSPYEQLNNNKEWYDYSNTGATANKWANARLNDGSLLVWIPRFTYKIISGEHTGNAGDIGIKFSKGTSDDTSDGYRIHPAFYWGGWNIPRSATMTKQDGGWEIKGIWVAKFEASSLNSKIQIKPGVASMRSLNVNQMFIECQKMQAINNSYYGITGDTGLADFHMMKNAEWGAVVYLSKYARGSSEVAINTNATYTSGLNDTSGLGMTLNPQQSTTGTIYGIYDMSGCAEEYIAAYIATGSETTYGSSLVGANAKYREAFPKGASDNPTDNYNALNLAYGHAVWETSPGTSVWNGSGWTSITSGWFGDDTALCYGIWTWFGRGGNNTVSTYRGLFAYTNYQGEGRTDVSFRIVACIP